MKLEDDHHCFACGKLNDSGLKLQFNLDEKRQVITTEFNPTKTHQGFKDIVHGGIIGLILDECMVNLAWQLGIRAVSAEYTVKLLNPAMIGKRLIFSAHIVSERKRILAIEAQCANEEGVKIAFSSSKCVKVPKP